MTRPVFEPSLTRADAAQAWGSRQLFRRPAPVSGEIVMDNAYLFFDDGMTVAGDGEFENITPYSTGTDGQYINAEESPGHFAILETGIYLITLVTVWDDSFAATKWARIAHAGTATLQDTLYVEASASAENTDLFIDAVTVSMMIYVTTDPPAGAVTAAVAQNSGAPHDLASADFSIVRMSEYVLYSS